MVLYCFLGVLIIPKWLINDSWHIAILFGSFLKRSKNLSNIDLSTPFLHRNTSKLQENYGNICKIITQHYGFPFVVNFRKDRHRQIPKNRLIISWNSCIWNQYIPQNVNGILLILLQYPLQTQNGILEFGNSGICEFGHLGSLESTRHHKYWNCCSKVYFQFLVPQKQLVSPSVLNKNGTLRWWNLRKSWIIVENPKT